MQPDGGKLPWGGVLEQIEKDFGSYSNFRDEFVQSAMTLFGSGWVWLACELIIWIEYNFLFFFCLEHSPQFLENPFCVLVCCVIM